MRADFEEDPLAGVDHRSHRVGEPHRLADARAPVLDVAVRPVTWAEVTVEYSADTRRLRGQAGQCPGQLWQDRVHQV